MPKAGGSKGRFMNKEDIKRRGLIFIGCHLPYSPCLIDRAKELRKNMTPAEKKLWFGFLRQFRYRFRSQHPIDNYIVDFLLCITETCHRNRRRASLHRRRKNLWRWTGWNAWVLLPESFTDYEQRNNGKFRICLSKNRKLYGHPLMCKRRPPFNSPLSGGMPKAGG